MRILVGIVILIGLSWLAEQARNAAGLSLPAPVVGFALLALLVVCLERFTPDSAQRFRATLEPGVRLLLSHMGLLFVPAGAGLITQGQLLKAQWLPISVALVGSTLLGLVATAAVTAGLGRKR